MRAAGSGLPMAAQRFRHRGSLLLVALLISGPGIAGAADECGPSTTTLRRSTSPARANDNRIAAGRMRAGVLEAQLVARAVSWRPDGPAGCPLAVHAFAEEGKSPSIPGPLLRVRAGTELRIRVRNALDSAIWVRGLQDRPVAAMDSTRIVPGASHEFRFRATLPGAWYYWAGAAGRTASSFPMSTEDGQLVGALIVDPAEGPTHDRVFVMTRWTPDGRVGNAGYQLNAINGRSWPGTERLTYTTGDSIRWHVVNASDELHMMHLHGFYFRVDGRGDVTHDSVLYRGLRPAFVTTATRRGEWISITWSPERSGNWLFHCHIVTHMSPEQRVVNARRRGPAHAHAQAMDAHGTHDMGGLILGVSVRPREARAARQAESPPARRLRVFANVRSGVYGDRPGFGFVLQQGDRAPARDSIVIPGTPLVLRQGEPVAITVHNRTTSRFGVHWHGIELESYFDGVAGWSGTGARLAPAIAPGDSFVARFTPPRAGTFIYHVHNEHGEELASGLYAPLLVLAPGSTLDPDLDRTVVVSTGGPGVAPPRAVNGKTTPDTISFVAGVTYRVRIIDISANEANLLELRGPKGTPSWRLLARDGMDVPANQRAQSPVRTVTAGGVTRDFELRLSDPGAYSLAVSQVVGGKPVGEPLLFVPILVRDR